MTPELLLTLSRYPLFPRTAADLVRVTGLEAAAAIISAWPGQEWPIPMRIGGHGPRGERRWAQLVEVAGEDAARRIVAWGGGGMLIVPNLKEVKHQRDQELIRSRYDTLIRDGFSFPEAVFELGVSFGLTGRAVEKIIKAPNLNLAKIEAQGSLF